MMQKRKLHVAMDDVLDAFETAREDLSTHYLDLEKGVVVWLPDDDHLDAVDDAELPDIESDPKRYAEIPRIESRDEYELMVDFSESVNEEDVREKLSIALQGKGAFVRFRNVVFQYPDLKATWFAMRQDMLVEKAKAWLDDLGIDATFDLRPLTAPSSNAQPASKPAPTIGLLDVLLLGAPDGKTERIGGRVRRQVTARTPSDARALFKILARELCAFFGVAWRNRFIEDTSIFEIERAHVSVEGVVVVVSIEVSEGAWGAFG